MIRLCMTASASALALTLAGCGSGQPLDEQITSNLTGTGWTYDAPPAPDVRATQWFGPGWANRDVSQDGGATWCRAGYTWSITNATDVHTFTIVYVHADDACGFVEGTDERFRFHMDPGSSGWATTGRFLPGEPADSTFGSSVALYAKECAMSSDAYASGCGEPNGAPAAPSS